MPTTLLFLRASPISPMGSTLMTSTPSPHMCSGIFRLVSVRFTAESPAIAAGMSRGAGRSSPVGSLVGSGRTGLSWIGSGQVRLGWLRSCQAGSGR